MRGTKGPRYYKLLARRAGAGGNVLNPRLKLRLHAWLGLNSRTAGAREHAIAELAACLPAVEPNGDPDWLKLKLAASAWMRTPSDAEACDMLDRALRAMPVDHLVRASKRMPTQPAHHSWQDRADLA